MAAERDDLQEETYRLARDNNRMLHAMRRNAFVGGLIKLAIYGVLIIAPLWFFAVYVNPILNSAMGTLNEVQGNINQARDAGAQIGVQFNGLNSMMERLKNIPGISNFGE